MKKIINYINRIELGFEIVAKRELFTFNPYRGWSPKLHGFLFTFNPCRGCQMKNPFYFIQALTLVLMLVHVGLYSQTTTLKGKVVDEKKQGIPGVNVLIKDSYDGGTTDENGAFSFITDEKGEKLLVATFIGFEKYEQKMTLAGGEQALAITLRESFNEMKVVTITAGAFEASDTKRATVLKALDIVTTAAAQGDTYGAIKTLPGAQTSSGDQEGLFVRGGSGSEAQTFIDGMLVRNPFFSSVPDIAQRGRFSPFLFKGTVFSTGGYSAQYGQGMSSALILDTQDLPDRSSTSLSLSSVGVGAGHYELSKDGKTAYGGDFNYTTLAPYYALVKQVPDYPKIPTFYSATGYFRHKTSETGMLKFYGYVNLGDLAIKTDNLDSVGQKNTFELQNQNVYTNLTYSDMLGKEWRMNVGLSFSANTDNITNTYPYGTFPGTFKVNNSLTQGKAVFSRFFGRLTTLRVGGEYQHSNDDLELPDISSSGYRLAPVIDDFESVFAESDLYLTKKFVARLGARFENSSFLNKSNLAPRVSLAYKLNDFAQFSFAYGDFYQKADSLLRWHSSGSQNTGFQKATHYILNYQIIANDRTLRLEGYYKNYAQLVETDYGKIGQALPVLSNNGLGLAKGFEVFYRDKASFKEVDYWVSYSWLDTKRQYIYYPIEAQPTYAANHNLAVRFLKRFTKIRSNLSVSYAYASGRPYFNPNRPASEFLTDKTPAYNNLSASVSYLTSIYKAFTVIVFSVTNILGNDQVFGYRYSTDGTRRAAINPPATRGFFAGMFLSWGQDRTKDVINNN